MKGCRVKELNEKQAQVYHSREDGEGAVVSDS